MSTPAWVAAMRERCAAATGGTWRREYCDHGPPYHEETGIITSDGPVVDGHRHDAIVGTGYYDGLNLLLRDADGDFIAHARADLPAVLGLAEALAEALEENQMRGGDDPCWCIEYDAELGHSPYCTRSREALARYQQGPGATTGGGDG